MDKSKRSLVNWMKAELYEYYRSEDAYRRLTAKAEHIEAMVNVHSPNLSGSHGGGRTNDQKLADYITAKQEIEDDLKAIDRQRKRTEKLLEMIPDKQDAEAIRRIYSGRKRIEQEAVKRHYTVSGFKSYLDAVMLKAVNKYLG